MTEYGKYPPKDYEIFQNYVKTNLPFNKTKDWLKLMEWEEYLSTIYYYHPIHPASFSGSNILFQEVKKKGGLT